MSSNKFKNNRESIEAKANELGISFEELLELENEFEVFSNKVKKNNERKRKTVSNAGKAAQPKVKAYRENNREKFIKDSRRGGVTQGNVMANKLKTGDPKTVKDFTKFRESGKSKGAKASAEAQIKSGRLGVDGEMSRYKRALNRIKWAKKLIPLKGIEFKSKDIVGKYITKAEFTNTKKLTKMLIVTNPGKRYSTFIINEKEVEYWANKPKPIIGEE